MTVPPVQGRTQRGHGLATVGRQDDRPRQVLCRAGLVRDRVELGLVVAGAAVRVVVLDVLRVLEMVPDARGVLARVGYRSGGGRADGCGAGQPPAILRRGQVRWQCGARCVSSLPLPSPSPSRLCPLRSAGSRGPLPHRSRLGYREDVDGCRPPSREGRPPRRCGRGRDETHLAPHCQRGHCWGWPAPSRWHGHRGTAIRPRTACIGHVSSTRRTSRSTTRTAARATTSPSRPDLERARLGART